MVMVTTMQVGQTSLDARHHLIPPYPFGTSRDTSKPDEVCNSTAGSEVLTRDLLSVGQVQNTSTWRRQEKQT